MKVYDYDSLVDEERTMKDLLKNHYKGIIGLNKAIDEILDEIGGGVSLGFYIRKLYERIEKEGNT